MIIEPVHADERRQLLELAVATTLFTNDDAEGLLGGVIDALGTGSLPEGHTAVACRSAPGKPALGWAYFAPDQYAEKVWNLWWIGVHPVQHGSGAGRMLLSHVENIATLAGIRVLVIETSDGGSMARARGFYKKAGYGERGRIPDFYAAQEAKVIFSKNLARPS